MEQTLPFIATTGVTKFLESGVGHLKDAVRAGARFVLIILKDGDAAAAAVLPARIKRQGVHYVREITPCDRLTFRATLAQAVAYAHSAAGGIAIIIATRPCLQGLSTDLPVADVARPTEPGDCEKCFEGFPVDPDPTSIFELAQQVARDRHIQHA